MPNSIFSTKSSTASKTSNKRHEEYNSLSQVLKNIVRRILICYKSLCCFPLDQIIPPKPRRYKTGLNISLKPGLCQTSEKVLNDIKIIHILPRSGVSFNDPARVKSEIYSRKLVRSEISNAKKVKSEISPVKNIKSEHSILKQVNEELPTEEKNKTTKTRKFKEKSKKILDFGSGSIKNSFKSKKIPSGTWENTSAKCMKKIKNDVHSENKWIRTKKMIKITNPSHLKWIRHTKPRKKLSTSSTDAEESAGDADGPLTTKVKEKGFSDHSIKKDVDKQVTLKIN